MEDLQQRARESGQQHTSHDPADLAFPQVPRHELNGHKHAGDITLPDLRTVLSPQFEASAQASAEAAFASRCSPMSAGSLPPIDIGHNAGYVNGTRRTLDSAILVRCNTSKRRECAADPNRLRALTHARAKPNSIASNKHDHEYLDSWWRTRN
jgi:hypothetical protein